MSDAETVQAYTEALEGHPSDRLRIVCSGLNRGGHPTVEVAELVLNGKYLSAVVNASELIGDDEEPMTLRRARQGGATVRRRYVWTCPECARRVEVRAEKIDANLRTALDGGMTTIDLAYVERIAALSG